VFTNATKGLVSNAITGTGNVVMSTSPTLVTPALGTPSSGVVTNLTGTASININGTVGATTPAAGSFTNITGSANAIISVTDNTNAALRITQLGTGDALLVEDETNPDASPFVIDNSGRTILGTTSSISVSGTAPPFQLHTPGAGASYTRWSSNATGFATTIAKSRSATIGTYSIVSNADQIGILNFVADDGTAFVPAASIIANVDGTPGTNDMPGRLVFSTTADGASSPTERMRISSTGQTTISGNTIISVTDNTNAALRITQLGTGNALLVEDIANPDSSPFLIDAGGVVVKGATQAYESTTGATPVVQLHGATTNTSNVGYAATNWATATGGSSFTFAKSRGGVIGTHAIAAANDNIGVMSFIGSDGTSFIPAAQITGSIDGTPGTNDMPGRLVFSTTADGASSPTERMRIDSTGDIGIGTTSPLVKLEIAGNNNTTWIVTASISGVTMDVTAVSSGTIAVGDLVYGANIQPYTRVTALGTGTGGVGTYTVSVYQTAASSATTYGTTQYGATLIRITDIDTNQAIGQPNGALQFFSSDASTPTAGVGAYVAALAESVTPDTALVFGTRDNAGGGVDANERMRIASNGDISIAGGTANGVTYLNGSKVLTSGTALTFDGTNLAVGGTSSARLDVAGWIRSNSATSTPSTGAGVEIGFPATTPWYGATPSGLVQAYDRTASAYLPLGFSGLNFAFAVSGSEGMRLTSTGLGIGTSSPTVKLHVIGVSIVGAAGTPGYTSYKSTGVPDGFDVGLLGGDASANGFIYNRNNGAVVFGTNANERMRLDSAGNLGIGTSSPAYKLDVTGSVRISSKLLLDTGTAALPSLTFSGWVDTGIYNPTGTSLGFSTNGAERMRLDSSGNLGLGVTPSAWGASTKSLSIGASGAAFIEGRTDAFRLNIGLNAYDTGSDTWKYAVGLSASLYKQIDAQHHWYNAPSGTAGAAITFTQAMTLDASGNLLVGQTARSQTVVGAHIEGGGGTNPGTVSSILAASTNAASSYNLYSTGAGAFRFYVGMGGTIFATSIVITAISDERLKENIRDIDTGLDAIMALQPRRFNWKEGKGQDKKNAAGFIAQEFENVFPECVSTSKAGGDGIEYKNINHETLIPTLVKAIQEQQALIESLTQRLTALESK